MPVNKVIYDGKTLVDLTEDTVTPETLAEGVTAHDKSGAVITGTMVAGSGGEENQIHELLNGSITEIDSDVTKIVQYACYGRASLTTVNLPNVTSIGSRAFQNCNRITSFNAPNVTSLGTYCFYGNNGMEEYNFPLAATIPANAFYSCAGLVTADFGVAKSIGGYGFYSCSKLETLILRKSDAIVTLTSTSLTASGIAKGTGYVYVPAALIDAYKENSTWATYADQFRAIEDYPDICG